MPIALPPATIVIVGIIGGIGAAGTYASFRYAERVGGQLELSDLLPAMPWEGLPVPRFFYTKPELVQRLRGK